MVLMIEIIDMSPEEFRLGYERYLMELPREPIDKIKMLEDLTKQNKKNSIIHGTSEKSYYDEYIKQLIKEGKARVIPDQPIKLNSSEGKM